MADLSQIEEKNLFVWNCKMYLSQVESQKACSDLCASTGGGLFWTWTPDGLCQVKNSDSGRTAASGLFLQISTHSIMISHICENKRIQNLKVIEWQRQSHFMMVWWCFQNKPIIQGYPRMFLKQADFARIQGRGWCWICVWQQTMWNGWEYRISIHYLKETYFNFVGTIFEQFQSICKRNLF